MLGTFCGDLCARRLLRRRWHHCGIRIRGLLKLSERQAEHVGHAPSYCGRASALPQVGQENLNPPLAGRQGFAALTSGRGSGGGSGGPVSSVRKGGDTNTEGYF
ncbi:hypothetical protein TcCL_NonESM01978 [Trypanosoma cruzi]|nr:hypothetical protein TcCL_NonESM01978 [Trypanosoma cruzi]